MELRPLTYNYNDVFENRNCIGKKVLNVFIPFFVLFISKVFRVIYPSIFLSVYIAKNAD